MRAIAFCCLLLLSKNVIAHDIIFCGERIPVENNFVSNTLMNVIKRQIPNVNLPDLRRRAEANFPLIETYLQQTGLPEDLKYVAIVESGFQNLISRAGAGGFWQLMPTVAQSYGLVVSDNIDERNNISKATSAACKVLAANYSLIRRKYGISSWVLAAAAYNTGIGNMFKNISRQGNDYFSMNLNPETAVYVYKIIAVKELFEYPELYMKDFGYNVFKNISAEAAANLENAVTDSTVFKSMVVNINANDGEHPDSISASEPIKTPTYIQPKKNTLNQDVTFVAANIKGKYKNFADGDLISIQLQDDLTVNGIFNRKSNTIKGIGWIIDDRIFIDLGYGDHTVTLISDGKKGIDMSQLKNNQLVLLRVQPDTD